MKNTTLEAFQKFIEETYRAIRLVADIGPAADTSALCESKDALWDALQNEEVTDEDPKRRV